MRKKQYYFTLKGALSRLKKEYNYYTDIPWSLEDVGKFWDTVTDYDDINSTLYPYFRRFTNSYELSKKYLVKDNYSLLDIQARSGNGAYFWYKKNKIKHATCVDFSDYLLSLAKNRLRNININCDYEKISNFPLPFKNNTFDFICTYETIEHIYDYEYFFNELTRVAQKGCIIILTCPNIMWEWVHWLCAIININHSEGPHRFLRRSSLIKVFNSTDVEILEENSTVVLPFNNRILIYINEVLEKYLPIKILRLVALRRTFVMRKL